MSGRSWIGAAALFVLLGGCKPVEPSLVLCAGGAPAEVAVWKELLAEYELSHPGLKVRLQELPADSDLQLQALGAGLGSGKAPFDLLRVDVVWMADFAARGWLQPLDGLLGAEQVAPFGKLADDLNRFEGGLFGIPWNIDVGLLYSRKDLLQKMGRSAPPRSFQELKDLAVRANRGNGGVEGYLWQGKAYEGLTCSFMEAYARAGGSAAQVESSGHWEAEPARIALKELKALLDAGASPVNIATEMDEEGARLLFQSGKALFMRNWPYAAALLEAEGSAVRDQVVVSPLPAAHGAAGPGTLGGWQLALRAGTPHAKEGAALIAFLTSRQVQARLATRLGWNPSRLDAYGDLRGPKAPAHLGAVRQALKSAVHRPRRKGYAAFSERSFQAVNQALLGRLSVDEAVQRLSAP